MLLYLVALILMCFTELVCVIITKYTSGKTTYVLNHICKCVREHKNRCVCSKLHISYRSAMSITHINPDKYRIIFHYYNILKYINDKQYLECVCAQKVNKCVLKDIKKCHIMYINKIIHNKKFSIVKTALKYNITEFLQNQNDEYFTIYQTLKNIQETLYKPISNVESNSKPTKCKNIQEMIIKPISNVESNSKPTKCKNIQEMIIKPISNVESNSKPAKRRNIPKCKRLKLWEMHFGTATQGVCPCCNYNNISVDSFIVGHRLAVSKGGSNGYGNLLTICRQCDVEMGTMHMHEYMGIVHLRAINL
ncbi:hypothetical protein F-VV10_0201 [Faustovirus]|nr:hypothetical protein F-VV10_0201 [Faustovirus]